MSAFPFFLRIRIEDEKDGKPLKLLVPTLLFLPFVYLVLILVIAIYFLGSLLCFGNAWKRPGHILVEPFRFLSALMEVQLDLSSEKGRAEIYFQ